MFGGYSDIHTLAPRSDTWQFTKDRGWYNATAVIAPEARSEHALATTGAGADTDLLAYFLTSGIE